MTKRRIALGIGGKGREAPTDISILTEADEGPKKKEFEVYDFSLEEEKDQAEIQAYVKRFKKVFQLIFKKYSNSGYSTKNAKSFDQMHSKHKTITLAEIIKCLKENHIMPTLISKTEAQLVLRKININQSDLKSTDFEGFVFFLLQTAMLVFS